MNRTLPFNSLLEYTLFFLELKKNILELKKFASEKSININGKDFDYFDYSTIVTIFYTHDTISLNDNTWLLFSDSDLDVLLEDEFFSEYMRTLKVNFSYTTRKYPFLEVYIYYKLHSIATDYLSYDETNFMAGNWLWNDKIEAIYNFGWYEIIANVYKNFGVHWFCDRETDPILYKFAYYAIMACKKSLIIPSENIKQDLIQLYSELLISFSIRDSLNQNMDIIELVKNAIINFDDDQLNKLTMAISTLEKNKFELIDSNKQLTEGITILREQITKLQQNLNEDNKIEKIIYQIYCLSPQNSNYESKYVFFKDIWDKLSDSTKKDIKQSITMFQKFDSIDLAIFPLLRSLEHEFIINFIQPFHQSSYYLELSEFICDKEKYQMTHDCLIKRNSCYPSIGSIPFNGIVHGNMELTAEIDKQCYSDITAMLYNPPVRILFEIIENSMRGELR